MTHKDFNDGLHQVPFAPSGLIKILAPKSVARVQDAKIKWHSSSSVWPCVLRQWPAGSWRSLWRWESERHRWMQPSLRGDGSDRATLSAPLSWPVSTDLSDAKHVTYTDCIRLPMQILKSQQLLLLLTFRSAVYPRRLQKIPWLHRLKQASHACLWCSKDQAEKTERKASPWKSKHSLCMSWFWQYILYVSIYLCIFILDLFTKTIPTQLQLCSRSMHFVSTVNSFP